MTPYDNIPDEALDGALRELEQKVQRKEQITRMLPPLRAEQERLMLMEHTCREAQVAGRRDVEKLKKHSPLVLWLTLTGRIDARMDQAERKAAEADARYEAVCAERLAVSRQIRAMDAEYKQLGLCKEHYEELLERKRQWLMRVSNGGEEIVTLSDELTRREQECAVLEETMHYGERILGVCEETMKLLKEAHDLGMLDITHTKRYGGSSYSTQKLEKLKLAQSHLNALHTLFLPFRSGFDDDEFRRLSGMSSINVVPSQGMQIMDQVFDNPITDTFVLEDIDRSWERVTLLFDAMQPLMDSIRTRVQSANAQRDAVKARLEDRIRNSSSKGNALPTERC